MGTKTNIEWCDHTFNPWVGCTKVSAGCANCYAEHSTPSRVFNVAWGKGAPRRRTSVANWKKPLAWAADPYDPTRRRRVFCGSLCDVFDPEVPDQWRTDLFDLIYRTKTLDWLLLTKRPAHAVKMLAGECGSIFAPETFQSLFPNVWFGVSAEDQRAWDERVPILAKIPAVRKFVSCEPLLGPIEMCGHDASAFPTALNWVIFGGESLGGRPCNVEWIRDGVRQARAFGLAVFVKQLGSNPILEPGPVSVALEDPKGGDIDEFPADLRIREWPVQRKTWVPPLKPWPVVEGGAR